MNYFIGYLIESLNNFLKKLLAMAGYLGSYEKSLNSKENIRK